MKRLIYAVLLASLLAGCADTPTQEATIEDRAVATRDAQRAADARASGAIVASRPVATGTQSGSAGQSVAVAKPVEKVETRPLTSADTDVKSLAGTQIGAVGADGKPIGTSGQAGAGAAQAGASGQGGMDGRGGSVILDPHNPNSPLAQRRILFDFDSVAIRDEYRAMLEAHAQYLKSDRAIRTILQGHTDERGSRDYNLALGQRRAEAGHRALSLLGVPDEQMEAVSLGEEKPVSEGHDEEAWKQNRRTEILYQGE